MEVRTADDTKLRDMVAVGRLAAKSGSDAGHSDGYLVGTVGCKEWKAAMPDAGAVAMAQPPRDSSASTKRNTTGKVPVSLPTT